MRHCNVSKFPIKLIRLVKETIDGTVANVLVPNRCESNGLKQGDCLALLLLDLIMEYVMRKVTVDKRQHYNTS